MAPQEVGYAGIIIALLSLLTKVWLDSTARTDKMIEAFKEHAIASTKLAGSIDTNTIVTKETKDASIEQNKNITVLISKVIALKRK